jgi:hypothetical protein
MSTTTTKAVIPATITTDDGAFEVKFNALKWFEQARDTDLFGLGLAEWGGDYESDAVATFMSSFDENVARVFRYIELRNEAVGHDDSTASLSTRRDRVADMIGFEVHVDSAAAMTWLAGHRPKIHLSMLKEA